MTKKPVKRSLLVKAEYKHDQLICRLPLIGGKPCLDFVNTVEWRLDPDRYRDTLVDYSNLLAFTHRVGLIDMATRRRLASEAEAFPETAACSLLKARAFRDNLATLIDDIAGVSGGYAAGKPRREAVALFDTARRRAHDSEVLSWADGAFVLIAQPEAEHLDYPGLLLVRDAETFLFSSAMARIRVCAGPGCGWVFLDTSKNGSRRWCSMKDCGNREKTRRFRSKPVPGTSSPAE